jgi:hypothetical protein
LVTKDRLKQKAEIKKDGAILLGKHCVCDGFDWDRSLSIISHVHGDHLNKFATSLGFYEKILVTHATRDMLIAMEGDWLRFRKNLKPISFCREFDHRDEDITLYPATHILGSAQILVEHAEGDRIVYTGDFLMPGTEPVNADILVMDATYGDPSNVRCYKRDQAIEQLISLSKRLLKQSSIRILGSKGKLQEVMNLLFEGGVEEPFLLPTEVFKMTQIYEKYGKKMGNYICMEEEEAKELIVKQQPHVAFHTMGSKVELCPKIKVSGYVTNWNSPNPAFEISKDYWMIPISDHADFKGSLDYVRKSKPKLVITDNHRCFGKAISLAQEIKKQLKIDAIPMPC